MSTPVSPVSRFPRRAFRLLPGALFFLPIIILVSCEEEATPPGKKGPRPNSGLREITISIGEVGITAEVADTPEIRRVGLMHRDEMPRDHGMLFIFEKTDFQRFYMKNTRIPLDIAFIREDGTVDQVKQMKPYSLERTYSQHKVKYALEMNEGWFEAHGLGPGDRVDLSALEG
jgi:uncharacterized membrane protein (UPF0127 family)